MSRVLAWVSELASADGLRRLAAPLRAANPRLYARLNRVRKRIIAGGEGLEAYQAIAVRRFSAAANLTGTRVLELGSDPELKALSALLQAGAREAVGVNNSPEIWAGTSADRVQRGALSLRNADAARLPFEERSFDHVFSVATLEHLLELPRVLDEAFRVLRPGGIFYASFGPIWSSGKGHHVRAEADGEEARHAIPEKNPLPDFCHLLLDREQLRAGLVGRVSPALGEAILAWVYDGQGINRRFHHEYVEAFRSSRLELLSLRPERDPIAPQLRRLLELRHPLERDFDVTNTEAILRRNPD